MIGVFDSGIGGLSILKPLLFYLPEYDYIYFADNKHMPYGDKSHKEIYAFSKAGIELLLQQGCSLVLVACNTISGQVLRQLQDKYFNKHYSGKKILGVVVPIAEQINEYCQENKNKKIAILATNATIKSRAYENKIVSRENKIEMVSGENLASLIEESKQAAAIKKATEIFSKLEERSFDLIVLACTHYPLILPNIKDNYKILDCSIQVAIKTKIYLEKHPEIEILLLKNKKRAFLSSGENIDFIKNVKRFISNENLEFR